MNWQGSKIWEDQKIADMKLSERAIEMMAHWIRERRGATTEISPLKLKNDGKELAGISDDGDCWVTYVSGTLQLIEGKWQKYFYDKWTWPHTDFIVDAVNTYEVKEHKPAYYCYINIDMTWMGFLPVEKTKDLWYIREGWCPLDRCLKDFYCIDLSVMRRHMRWVEIPRELREIYYPGDKALEPYLQRRKQGQNARPN